MKVVFDYQGFQQRIGGVSRCFVKLAEALKQYAEVDYLIRYTDNLYLNDMNDDNRFLPVRITEDNFCHPFKFFGRRSLCVWLERHFESFPTFLNSNKRYVIQSLAKTEFDIYHCTYYDDFFVNYLQGRPFVVTVHDMICEMGLCASKNGIAHKRKICMEASQIIAVSECTKRDLVRLWGIQDDKISVVYHGAPEPCRKYGERIYAFPYFLFVGGRWEYKNFKQTIFDFAAFSAKHQEVKLVCTGAPFSKEEEQLISNVGITGKVIYKFANDVELANLYHFALAFVYPSIYEGFGIPIIEAFTYGCIALLNNKSCFPEVGGNAALYFDSNLDGPSNLPDLLEKIYSLTEIERASIIQRGYERAKLFSWSDSARRVYEIYKKLLCVNNLC